MSKKGHGTRLYMKKIQNFDNNKILEILQVNWLKYFRYYHMNHGNSDDFTKNYRETFESRGYQYLFTKQGDNMPKKINLKMVRAGGEG